MTKRRASYVELPPMNELMQNAMESSRAIERVRRLEECDILVRKARIAVNTYAEKYVAGQSAYEASEASNIAYQQAKEAIDKYNELYPPVPPKTFWQKLKIYFTKPSL